MIIRIRGIFNVTYFETKNEIITSMKWTHKGALFLYNKLKSFWIVPFIENKPRYELKSYWVNKVIFIS